MIYKNNYRDDVPSYDSYHGKIHATGDVTLAYLTLVLGWSSNQLDQACQVRPLCDASENNSIELLAG